MQGFDGNMTTVAKSASHLLRRIQVPLQTFVIPLERVDSLQQRAAGASVLFELCHGVVALHRQLLEARLERRQLRPEPVALRRLIQLVLLVRQQLL